MGKAQLYYNDNRQNHNSGDYNCYKCCDLGSFVLTCIVLVQNKKNKHGTKVFLHLKKMYQNVRMTLSQSYRMNLISAAYENSFLYVYTWHPTLSFGCFLLLIFGGPFIKKNRPYTKSSGSAL